MLCSNFGWNWLSGSGEDFLKLSMPFHYAAIISFLKKAWSFICSIVESLEEKCLKELPWDLGWGCLLSLGCIFLFVTGVTLLGLVVGGLGLVEGAAVVEEPLTLDLS